jgi:glucuronoarabinoxylan endo-1,4-beta-xylanase
MKIKMTICFTIVMAILGFITLTNAVAGDVTVNVSTTHQIIRGFGGSSAWSGAINDATMDALYKTAGLSILRLRIDPNKNWSDELSNAKKAIARGAIVFASPWSAPASMKSNNNVNGGSLNTSQYGNYASFLKSFVDYLSQNGVTLYAISIQNEPDYVPTTYESCGWTAAQLDTFLQSYGSTLAASAKIIMPESCSFNQSVSDTTLNDSAAAQYVSIIGEHLYGATIKNYSLAFSKGKEVWETEHYFSDDNIGTIMTMAKEIHDCMVTGNMSAYVYWWMSYDSDGICSSSGTLWKRGYLLGQFSKNVRNGFYRVDATATPSSGVYVSAYNGNNQVVIVAINSNTSSVSQNFVFPNNVPTQVSSYYTNSSSNMATGSSLTLSGTGFTATLQAQSVTTFVGSIGSIETPAPTPVPTIGPTAVPGTVSIACGSTSAVGDFQPDQYYSGGSTYNNTNTIDVSGITSNPPPAALFNNERYGAMSYTIPGFTSGGIYNVTLYFAETYLTSSGSRVFNISINDSATLSNFDIFATTGAQNKATAKSFTTTADSNGQIVIQFTAVTENPKLNGISIIPATAPTAAPTAVPTTVPGCTLLGDVNGSGTIDIVDALLSAQYYVGLETPGFNRECADTNCSGSFDIVDSLLIAQYYVGLIDKFC